MLKVIRYALAAICLTASVSCLALWWRSLYYVDHFSGPNYFAPSKAIYAGSDRANCHIRLIKLNGAGLISVRTRRSQTGFERISWPQPSSQNADSDYMLGYDAETLNFPHWYAALILALAAVAALRIGQRFTLRSALVGTTIVATLCGIVAAR